MQSQTSHGVLVSLLVLASAVPATAAVLPGAIPATFQVGGHGDARYSMPIATPAATGGLRPNLALSYNHVAGDGLAGMRWTLAGFSAITRCPRTYAQDNVAAGFSYASTDKLCLDGQRLVEYQGPYGDSGTQYRTEIETFQKITQENTQGNGALQFRVDHGNGTHSYYGATPDSRVEAPAAGGSVRAWYISYTEDQFQNRINYYYDENITTGEVVPFRVMWTSNAPQELSALYRVEISYETRPADDQRSGHDTGGAPWAKTKRIDRIDVIFNGTTVNTYDLTYSVPPVTGTGRSQLQSVTLSGAADALPSTVFTPQNGTRGWAGLTATGRATGTYPLLGDVNNDGRQDVFVCLSGIWHAYPGEASALLGPAIPSSVSCATNPEAARVIDFNADGRADLLYQSLSDWYVLVSNDTWFANTATGITVSSMPNPIIVADYDGDGLGDLIQVSSQIMSWRRNTGSAFAAEVSIYAVTGSTLFLPYSVRSLDVNGDRRGDFVVTTLDCVPQCQYVTRLLLTTATGFTEVELHQGPTFMVGDVRSIDVNGDGLEDLLYVYGGWWMFQLSQGASLGSRINTGILSFSEQKFIVVDYDGDGRDDFVRTDSSTPNSYLIHRSNGTTIPSAYTDSLPSFGAHSAAALMADVSGDGFPEIVRTFGPEWATHKHASALSDVVTTFTEGLGYTINVSYEALSNSSNYSQTIPLGYLAPGTEAYIHKYRGSRHVVVAENHDDGIGGTRPFVHYYDSAYVDVSGRGWYGFKYHRVLDSDQGTYKDTHFVQVWPWVGYAMPDHVELHRASDGQLIRKVDPGLAKTTNTAPTPDLHFVRPETITTREYEVGGVANGQHLRTILEDPVYDATYGHVTSSTTTITDPSTAESWTSTTNFNPTVDSDDWCLGQPGLVETTNTLPSLVSAGRRVNHVWSPNNCSLSETTDLSEINGAKQLKTTFTYDGYGNPDVVSQDSADSTAQNRSTDFTFDGFGQYPSVVTVGSLNLTTQFTWNYLNGQRASVTGPDGLTTSWLYDPFGRVIQETRPVGSTTVSYAACGTCWPLNAAYYARAQSTDGADSYEFFDELGRPVGSSWKMPLGGEGRQETRYLATGGVDKVSQPYAYSEPTFWTEYSYDIIGRLIEVDAPVNESITSGATTVYDYRGHDVWITDAESNTTKYTQNAARQIKQVVDAMNGTTAYTYKGFGELATARDAEFNTTSIDYDARGFKTSLTDPNMGNWVYDTNAYGELTNQRSPLTASPNWTTTLTYDEAGRIKTRCDVPEGTSTTACGTDDTTTWVYYASTAAQANRGKIDTITGPGNQQKYTYSLPHGLPTQLRHTVDGTNYFYDMTYDSQARLNVLTYPTSTSSYRFKVDYDYDTSGHLTVAKDGNTPSLVYYRLDAADALGRELTSTLGNGLHEYRDYDRAAGHLLSIQADPGLGTSIQNLSFTHDEVGNVLTRTNWNIGKTETFSYDDLNRVETSQVTGLSLVTNDYSDAGRIESRTDVGSYTYTGGCGGGPLAVKSAAGKTYCYDAAGRMTSRGGSAITWFAYDRPKKINNGTVSAEFTYGVDRTRTKQIRKTGSTTNATILYIGGVLEKETASGTTTWRHYVGARGRVVAQVNRVNTTNTAQYLHRDHQSSVVEVTNSAGAPVQSLAYDAWGLRRNPATWTPLASPFGGTQPTKRGYTGHEHLDNVELIHMNGRVQDPKLGLFISADPFVQAPFHSPSLNRYSYVWNNPASLVDPSGFQSCSYDADVSGLPPHPMCQMAFDFAEQLAEYGYAHAGDTAMAVTDQIDIAQVIEQYHRRNVNFGIEWIAGTSGGQYSRERLVPLTDDTFLHTGTLETADALFDPVAAEAYHRGQLHLMLFETVVFGAGDAAFVALGAPLRAATMPAHLAGLSRVASGTATFNRLQHARAVADFVSKAQAQGFQVIGREVSFRTPFGRRAMDVVLRNPATGQVGGVEIKSSIGAFNRFDPAARQQFAADRWINRYGADAVGAHSGLRIDNTIKMLWTTTQ